MPEKEQVKNDMDFTPITVPTYNFIAIYGSIRGRMPDFKKAIEQGYRIGNYRDLALNRMEKHNPDENDRKNLNDNYFTLVGNPTLGDPMESGEQFIINDLEQKVFEPIKLQLLNMNSSTKLNGSWALPLAPSKEQAKDIYEQIKTNGMPYITILSPQQVSELRNDAYSIPGVRENMLEGFFQGNISEMREYIHHVQTLKEIGFEKILGYYPGKFTDTRLVWAGSVGDSADAYCGGSLNSIGRLFGVGAGAPTTKPN
ncbi:MAG: hypothetical protein WC758_00110 [Candidatus Woesearchaeota archaeon]|jgi:hypothetical protein